MTARLVLLMSLVLFLSLLAFSLLLNHSRTAVLEQVERTVRSATHETMNAMTWRNAPGLPEEAVLERVFGFPIPPDITGTPAGTFVQHDVFEQVSIEVRPTTPLDPKRTAEAQPDPSRQERTGDAAARKGAIEHRLRNGRFVVIAHDEPRIQFDENARALMVTATVLRSASIEGTDSKASGRTGVPSDATSIAGMPLDIAGSQQAALRDDLQFQVPIDPYSQVFDVIRDRMLWISIGVFLLGVGLSVGLARHFTRPIRELDTALARIAGGDLDVTVSPSGTGEVARLAYAFNTMTDELRKNRDRERELVRREKLSSLGRLAAGVAHDVRNPLHSIGLTLQNLEDVCRPEAESQLSVFERAIGLIRREIKRLDGLVAHFLSFARNEAAEKSSVRLPELVRDTAQLVAKEAERRQILVVVDAEPTLEAIPAVPAALRSAVLNLVLNAFEATPPGGSVTLRVTARDGMQYIDVADTGRGIPESERERVFDFGYSTRDGGHGLGLAMVHHTVVEEHGGRIRLDSKVGKGTTVTIELPVVRAESTVSAAPANEQESA